MIGDVIQEYLVRLGVDIDKPAFNEINKTINTTTSTIEAATGRWSKDFIKASGLITMALAGITTAVAGVMKAAASQDLAMEKLSRQMMVSKDAAWEMKKATDALGESVSDIVITPELMERYQKLVADGSRMKVGGDFAETMKGFRDLMFEFTRLKQEVSYAMTWVGYYLLKYLNRPLAEAQARFQAFNDSFVRNMASWTEKLARALVYIINIGLHFFDLIKSIITSVYELWNAFPKGVKIAIAALGTLFAFVKMSPFGRMLALVSALFLLIDDYFGHFEGKQALFGKYWEKLHAFIEVAKQKIIEFAHAAEPILGKFIEYVFIAADKLAQFGKWIAETAAQIKDSTAFKEFCDTMERLGKALYALGAGVIDEVITCIEGLKESMGRNETGEKFTALMDTLWKIFLGLVDAISYCIEAITNWLSWLSKTEEVRDFLDAVAELLSVVLELAEAILDLVRTVFREFFGVMDDTEPIFSFREAIKTVVKIITAMIRVVAFVTKALAKFLKMMASNTLFREFWSGLGKAVKTFGSIIDNVITLALKKVGKFGRALLCLIKGDFAGAYAIVSGGSTAPGKGNAGESAAEMAEYLIDNGVPVIAAMGVMGNIGGESSYNPEAYIANDRDGNPSGGLAQWHAERFDQLQAFAADRGTDWTDRKTQLDFLLYELQTNYADVYERMKHASSVEEATEIFLRWFEKPENPDAVLGERISNAQAVHQEVIARANRPSVSSQPITAETAIPNPLQKIDDTYNQVSLNGSMWGANNFMGAARRAHHSLNRMAAQVASVVNGYSPAYAGANTVTYHISVGDVNVAQTNANPQEIGHVVANEILKPLNQRGEYILQNRVLTGGPNVV